MKPDRNKKPGPPLDRDAMERLALLYVGRYATTKAKLSTYLRRKLRERGWDGEETPDVASLVARIAGLGYVDDSAFASARAASLNRRGYGEHRVAQALLAAGIGDDDAVAAKAEAHDGAWGAALRFAQRKRIGPFASVPSDRVARSKAFAAMMRAGHPLEISRRMAQAEPGDVPESPID